MLTFAGSVYVCWGLNEKCLCTCNLRISYLPCMSGRVCALACSSYRLLVAIVRRSAVGDGALNKC